MRVQPRATRLKSRAAGQAVVIYNRLFAIPRRQWQLLGLAGLLLIVLSVVCALIPSPLVIALLFLIVGVGSWALLHPGSALLLVFACAGFPALILPLPGHNLHLIEPALLLCLLVIIVRHPLGRLHLPHLLACLFFALALLSFLHVPQFSSGVDGYAPDKRLLALLMVMLAFFSGTFLAGSIASVASLLSTILLVNLPLYLVGLAQVWGIQLSPLLEAPGAYSLKLTQGRLWGSFPWSVNFGMYLVNLFVIALVCWLLGTQSRIRLLGFIFTLITALEIIGSGTRSVGIAAAAVLIVAFIFTKRLKQFVITLVLTSITVATFFSKVQPLFVHDETSTANRLLIWNEAIKLIIANPWLGIGLQQFHNYYAQLIVSRATELGPQGIHPHQQYLEWAMESGIPWLIVGLLLLLSILFTCAQAYASVGRDRQMALLAAILAILANCIIGFFDAPLDQLEGPVCLFLLAGLAVGYSGTYKRQEAVYRWPTWRFPWSAKSGQSRTVSTPQPTATKESIGEETTGKLAIPNTHKTGRSIILQLLSWGIAIPFVFPMTALLARYLGPVQYGEYSLTFPFLTTFALLSGTGMDPLLVRQLSRRPPRDWSSILSYALGTRLLSTLLSGCLAAIIACLLPIDTAERNLFLLGSVSLLFSFSFNGVRIVFSHGFRAEQHVGLLSLLETLNRVLTAALVALAILLHLSLLWTYVLLVYSDIPAFFLQALLASKRFSIRLHFSWQHFRRQMLAGLPLLGHNMLTLLAGQIDLFILLIAVGPRAVGIYALASRAVDPLAAIAIAYVNGLYPLLCTCFAQGQARFAHIYQQAMRVLALASIPLAVCISVEANKIVALLGGQNFSAATTSVRLLVWAMVATFFSQVCERACMAVQRERYVPLSALASVSVNILANILLIPTWQMTGAALAALLSECVGLCVLAAFLKGHVRLLATAGLLLLVLIANLPALAFLLWQSKTSPILTIPLALLLTILSYLLTRTLSLQDIAQVKSIVQGTFLKDRGGNASELAIGEQRTRRSIANENTLILPSVRI